MTDADDSTPSTDPCESVTELLVQWTNGDPDAREVLMPLVYAELKKTASALMRRERGGHTLQPTALVHEAWLRLVRQDQVRFEHRRQFFGLAAQIMRRILVDHARAAGAEKRGSGAAIESLDDRPVAVADPAFELMALDRALTELAEADARQAQIIELRYFGGLSVYEAAELLGVSAATVSRSQRAAEAWLLHAINGG